MRRFLLATTAIAALAAHVQMAQAADATGYADYPSAFISFEGGYYFNASQENVDFDDDDSELGNLDSLRPGGNGWQGRFELGQRLNETWDFKIGLSAIALGSDSTDDNDARSDASQDMDLQILDLEAGYHLGGMDSVEARLFAGVRGLHARSQTSWHADEGDKLGEFDDEVYALGPRVGVDLAVPMDTHDIALVGSVSGSLLFGTVDSEASYRGDPIFNDYDTDTTDTQTLWNVEGMAGVAFGIGERADLTLGYRVAQFGDLAVDRSDVDKAGDFSANGESDLLLHGPFARLTVEIP
ncbi:MAG: hypothetical protein IOC86_08780 [Aestuariivirga sp.]|nr:hypothetical protein [Aestuariivirga sp.]